MHSGGDGVNTVLTAVRGTKSTVIPWDGALTPMSHAVTVGMGPTSSVIPR